MSNDFLKKLEAAAIAIPLANGLATSGVINDQQKVPESPLYSETQQQQQQNFCDLSQKPTTSDVLKDKETLNNVGDLGDYADAKKKDAQQKSENDIANKARSEQAAGSPDPDTSNTELANALSQKGPSSETTGEPAEQYRGNSNPYPYVNEGQPGTTIPQDEMARRQNAHNRALDNLNDKYKDDREQAFDQLQDNQPQTSAANDSNGDESDSGRV